MSQYLESIKDVDVASFLHKIICCHLSNDQPEPLNLANRQNPQTHPHLSPKVKQKNVDLIIHNHQLGKLK